MTVTQANDDMMMMMRVTDRADRVGGGVLLTSHTLHRTLAVLPLPFWAIEPPERIRKEQNVIPYHIWNASAAGWLPGPERTHTFTLSHFHTLTGRRTSASARSGQSESGIPDHLRLMPKRHFNA